MEQLTPYLPYVFAMISSIAAYLVGKRKSDSEIELNYAKKYAEDMKATETFRNLLITENRSLVSQIESLNKKIIELEAKLDSLNGLLCKNSPTCVNRSK